MIEQLLFTRLILFVVYTIVLSYLISKGYATIFLSAIYLIFFIGAKSYFKLLIKMGLMK